jgi:hypothetical protein
MFRAAHRSSSSGALTVFAASGLHTHVVTGRSTSPFKSAGTSVQSTTDSRGVRISGSTAGYTMFHSIRQFPLHFPTRASPCAILFQMDSRAIIHHTYFAWLVYI